jgi:hypothetical protein
LLEGLVTEVPGQDSARGISAPPIASPTTIQQSMRNIIIRETDSRFYTRAPMVLLFNSSIVVAATPPEPRLTTRTSRNLIQSVRENCHPDQISSERVANTAQTLNRGQSSQLWQRIYIAQQAGQAEEAHLQAAPQPGMQGLVGQADVWQGDAGQISDDEFGNTYRNAYAQDIAYLTTSDVEDW